MSKQNPLLCKRCNREYSPYNALQLYCSAECRDRKYELYDDVRRKAWSLGANLRLGKGKSLWLEEKLQLALGTPCVYCQAPLTLKNVSIDHKEPFADTTVRRNKTANTELREHMDRKENLQFICRNCNMLKSDLTDVQYRQLLTFLESNDDLKKKIMKRLSHSKALWGFKRK